MLTYLNILIMVLVFFITGLIYVVLPLLKTRLFDKYFEINLEESYNLNNLFPIKIKGGIVPKVDFLEIPYENLNIEINTKTIRGNIINNKISLELIKPTDRRNAIYLVKKQYIKNVKSYINETTKNNKDYIELIRISEKQKNNIEKIACKTCKNKIQCKILFKECNYLRENKDEILQKGLMIKNNINYEMNNKFE